jgi:hypothetical protein
MVRTGPIPTWEKTKSKRALVLQRSERPGRINNEHFVFTSSANRSQVGRPNLVDASSKTASWIAQSS